MSSFIGLNSPILQAVQSVRQESHQFTFGLKYLLRGAHISGVGADAPAQFCRCFWEGSSQKRVTAASWDEQVLSSQRSFWKLWVRDYDGTFHMSKLPSAHLISQMRKLRQVCIYTRKYGKNGQLPPMAKLLWVLLLLPPVSYATSPVPVKSLICFISVFSLCPMMISIQVSVILANPALFPVDSNFCHLH